MFSSNFWYLSTLHIIKFIYLNALQVNVCMHLQVMDAYNDALLLTLSKISLCWTWTRFVVDYKCKFLLGSTALVALLSGNILTVANVGDSRGVLCDEHGNAVPLSVDHKPNSVWLFVCFDVMMFSTLMRPCHNSQLTYSYFLGSLANLSVTITKTWSAHTCAGNWQQ